MVGSKAKPTVIEAATSHVGSEQSEDNVSRPIRTLSIPTSFEALLLRRPSRWLNDQTSAGAIRKRYIQANPPWLRSWLIFDIDRGGAALAWDDAYLPEPFWTSQMRWTHSVGQPDGVPKL